MGTIFGRNASRIIPVKSKTVGPKGDKTIEINQ